MTKGGAGPGAAVDLPWIHLFTYGSDPESDAEGLPGVAERVRDAAVRGTLFRVENRAALVLAGTDVIEGAIWRCDLPRLRALDGRSVVERRLLRRVGLEIDGLACWTYVAGPRLAPELRPDRRAASAASPPSR